MKIFSSPKMKITGHTHAQKNCCFFVDWIGQVNGRNNRWWANDQPTDQPTDWTDRHHPSSLKIIIVQWNILNEIISLSKLLPARIAHWKQMCFLACWILIVNVCVCECERVCIINISIVILISDILEKPSPPALSPWPPIPPPLSSTITEPLINPLCTFIFHYARN